MAKQNAAIYGVRCWRLFQTHIKGDVIVTSPPEYNKIYVIGPLDSCMDKILEVGKTIVPKILLHLPKNLDKKEVCTSFSLKYKLFLFMWNNNLYFKCL